MNKPLIHTIQRSVRRFGPMMLATVSAQATSAVALITVAATLSPSTSDTYVIGMQLATAPLSAVVIGVVYNATVGRPGYRRWWRFAIGSLLFGLTTAVVVLMVTALTGRAGSDLWSSGAVTIVLSLAGGGIILASLGVFAVRDALQGSPLGLATLSLPSNLALIATCVVVALTKASLDLTTLPALAWSATAVIQGVVVVVRSYKRTGATTTPSAPSAEYSKMPEHVIALGVGALTASVFPALYVAIASELSAGTATVVFIAGRLGAAGIGLFVNAILTVQYRWAQPRQEHGRSLATAASAISLPVGAGAFLWHAVDSSSMGPYALTAVFLFGLLAAAAVSLRELNARLSVRAIGVKGALDLVASTLAVAAYAATPSITGYFGAFAVSQAVTLCVSSVALRSPWLTALAITNLLLAAAFLVFGW